MSSGTTYRIEAFARLTGVTAKALRLYDRLGLMHPARTDAGYRVYEERHRRQVTYLSLVRRAGLPLAEVKRLLHDRDAEWTPALVKQRARLEAKRQELDRAFAALDTLDGYFVSPPRVAHRASPSRLRLYADGVAALGRPAADPIVQALVDRWRAILEFESGGDPDALREMRRVFASRRDWPLEQRRYVASMYGLDVETWLRVADLLEEGARRRSLHGPD